MAATSSVGQMLGLSDAESNEYDNDDDVLAGLGLGGSGESEDDSEDEGVTNLLAGLDSDEEAVEQPPQVMQQTLQQEDSDFQMQLLRSVSAAAVPDTASTALSGSAAEISPLVMALAQGVDISENSAEQGVDISENSAYLSREHLEASAEELFAHCKNGHALVDYITECVGYCDGCRKNMLPGEHVMDCRICNFYLCGICSGHPQSQTGQAVAHAPIDDIPDEGSESQAAHGFYDKHDSTIEAASASLFESEDAINVLEDVRGMSDLEVFGRLAHGRTTLSLKELRLSSLEPLGLQALTSLQTLCLSGNEFADSQELADSLGHLRGLIDLDVSRCRLSELPILQQLQSLRRINASRNVLKSSRGILYCTDLNQVLLSHNHLRRIEQLETLKNLEELDVSHNRLGPTTLAAMRTVSACAKLRVLLVAGNPFSSGRAHHVQLTDLIPSLELIDTRRVQTLRCRSGFVSTSGSLTSASHVKALRCPARGSAKSNSGKIGEQNLSIADTSISYGLLSRSSPSRRSGQGNAPRYKSPTRSFEAHRARIPEASSGRKAKRRPSQSGKRRPNISMSALLDTSVAVSCRSVPGSPTRLFVGASCLSSPNARVPQSPVPESPPPRIPGPVSEPQVGSDVNCEGTTVPEVRKEVERLTLQELLEEKQRLLRKVSAQLSGGSEVRREVLQHAAPPVFPRATLDASPSLPNDTTLANESIITAALATEVPMDFAAVRATMRAESLRATLRDGIERKRALLDQLRCV